MSKGPHLLHDAQFEPAPIRLPLARGAAARSAEAEKLAAVACIEEAKRRGYEEGLQQGRADGWSSGHEEGLQQGREQGESRVSSAVTSAVAEAQAPLQEQQRRLATLVTSIDGAMEECLALAEEEMLALCYETVCRVLATHALQPEVVRAQLAGALTSAKAEPMATLQVHEQDLALLTECGVVAAGPQQVCWVASDEVSLGGCILTARAGALDARLETMLVACKSLLLQERARRRTTQETAR